MFPLSKIQFVSLLVFIALAFLFAFVAEARQLELNYPNLPGLKPLGPEIHNTTLPELLVYLYTFFVVIGGLIAFGSMVFAGFLFMASGANPSLRNQAKNRIQQAVLGLVLLLGAYIILSTINPELVLLHAPGVSSELTKPRVFTEPSGVLDTADVATLRYGGVVVFEEPNTDGSTGRSETVFHDVGNLKTIGNFETASYINSNGKISAIKIVGGCTVNLINQKGEQSLDAVGHPGGPINAGSFRSFNENVKGLKLNNKSCLGHSIKIFENKNYDRGALTFITDEVDLQGRDFVKMSDLKDEPVPLTANDEITSVRFAFDAGDSQVPAKAAEKVPLKVSLCADKGFASSCFQATSSIPDISSVNPKFNDKISSMRFDVDEYRQAGVVLYEHSNFGGRQEVFIASDMNLKPSFVQEQKLSSLKIVGRYRVTIYAGPSFGGQSIVLDNSSPDRGVYVNSVTGKRGNIPKNGAILDIPDLGAKELYCFENKAAGECKDTFNDKIQSVKIELPTDVASAHGIICSDVNLKENFCVL